MSYRAVLGLAYPDAVSLAIVRAAGGLSQLTEDQRASLQFHVVEPGDICDELPEESIPWLLEQGAIAPVDDEATE